MSLIRAGDQAAGNIFSAIEVRMYFTTSDPEIFALLERANEAGFDPRIPLVKDFEFDGFYFLLLFNPAGELRGCRLYSIALGDGEQGAGRSVLNDLIHLPDAHGYFDLKTKALILLEKFLSGRKNASRYFDAH